jgi:hypothetical protein
LPLAIYLPERWWDFVNYVGGFVRSGQKISSKNILKN